MFSFLKKSPLTEEDAIDNFIVRIYLMFGLLFGALIGSAAGWYSIIPVVFIILIFVVVTLNDAKRIPSQTDEELRADGWYNMHPDDETKTVLKCIHGNEAPDFSGCECRLMWRAGAKEQE